MLLYGKYTIHSWILVPGLNEFGQKIEILFSYAKSAKILFSITELLKYILYLLPKLAGPVVQLDRISDFGSDGWGFDSLRGHKKLYIERCMAFLFLSLFYL